MMNKTCKNHKLLIVTERIFCNNPIILLLGFCQGIQGDTNFWVGQQKYVTVALYCIFCSTLLRILFICLYLLLL